MLTYSCNHFTISMCVKSLGHTPDLHGIECKLYQYNWDRVGEIHGNIQGSKKHFKTSSHSSLS